MSRKSRTASYLALGRIWHDTGADPGAQTVSLKVALNHPPGSRLPLLSGRPAVTFLAEERHRP